MIHIKICGLTNWLDARWAWRCGADLLGFIFVPGSPRYMRIEDVAPITKALLKEGCQARFVGVFADRPATSVREIAEACHLHLVQLHGQVTPQDVAALQLPAIVAVRVSGEVAWGELRRYDAWGYLLDTHDPDRLGGTGRPWDWEQLGQKGDRPARLIVAGGLTPDNVITAIRRTHPWGVDVSSGVEAMPGRKDPAKVAAFIRRVRAFSTQRDGGEVEEA